VVLQTPSPATRARTLLEQVVRQVCDLLGELDLVLLGLVQPLCKDARRNGSAARTLVEPPVEVRLSPARTSPHALFSMMGMPCSLTLMPAAAASAARLLLRLEEEPAPAPPFGLDVVALVPPPPPLLLLEPAPAPLPLMAADRMPTA
jgi:hypothetical protein